MRPRSWFVPLLLLAVPVGAQLQPGLARGPYLQAPAPTSIVVRWRTDLPADSRVRYGEAGSGLDREATVAGLRTEHAVRLTGLEPERRYEYAIGTSAGDLASGPAFAFLTPPVAGSRRPVRIWAFGDAGHPQRAEGQAAVRDAYLEFTAERGTDVWIVLGDNAYFAGSDADYQLNFFGPYRDVLRGVPVWSALGNHDGLSASSADGTGPYYDIFDFPTAAESGGEASGTEAWYSFDHANVHFVALDSQESARTPGSPMLDWLERDLAANRQEWTIAFFHHPVYSFGTHNSDTDTGSLAQTAPDPADDFAIQEMREHVLPILEAGGVDLVLTAHSHNYERSFLIDGHYGTSDTLAEGMKVDPGDGRIEGDGPYRKTGEVFADAHAGAIVAVVGTGAEAAAAGDHPAMVAKAAVPGSLVVDVDGARLDGTFVDRYGNELDRFTLLRGDGFNFPPVARDDAAATAPGLPVRIPLLANDTDPDDDLLLVESTGVPAHGSLDDHGDGSVTYQPDPDFTGGEDGFTYTITDGQGHRASATVRVGVACPPAAEGGFTDDFEPAPEPGWSVDTATNLSPASAPWAVVEEAAGSPLNAWFSASDAATSRKDDRLVSPPLDLSSSSSLSFRHRYATEAGYDGGVLELSADGGASWVDLGPAIRAGGYDEATIGVDGARRRAWTGSRGEAMEEVRVDLGAFAGPARRLRWRLVADDFTAETTAGWWVDDVEVSALVSGPGRCNLPPIATDDLATTTAGEPVSIDVLANDRDPEGGVLSIEAVGVPAHGVAAIADGRLVYTPEAGYVGGDQLDYRVTDGESTAAAIVVVTVLDTEAGPSRARGHGDVDDGSGPARFAFHARREAGSVSGWLRFRDVEGWIGDLRFPSPGTARLEGVCWQGDGSPCSFVASVEATSADHPGRFAIDLLDAAGALLESVSGPLLKGAVTLD